MNNFKRISVLSFSLLFYGSTLAIADTDKPTFEFQAGASIAQFDSDITVNGDQRGNNIAVDMENDLNVDEDVDLFSFKASWRFAKKHRLSLEYVPFSRSSSVVLDKNFGFEDDVIQVGADVSTDADYRVYDFNYIYSFYNTPSLELGVSAGVYWMDLEFSINASGNIEDENGSVSFDGDYSNSVSTNIPLPLLGLTADYQLTPKWSLHGVARYFELAVDDFDGSIVSLTAGADYAIHKNLSVGLSLLYFDLNVGVEDSAFHGNYEWAYSGAQLYLATRF